MGAESFPAGITLSFHLNDKFLPTPIDKSVPVSTLQLFKQNPGTTYQTSIQQCYSKKIILLCLICRLLYSPHTVANLEPSVPQRVENSIRDFADFLIFGAVENHQVNI